MIMLSMLETFFGADFLTTHLPRAHALNFSDSVPLHALHGLLRKHAAPCHQEQMHVPLPSPSQVSIEHV